MRKAINFFVLKFILTMLLFILDRIDVYLRNNNSSSIRWTFNFIRWCRARWWLWWWIWLVWWNIFHTRIHYLHVNSLTSIITAMMMLVTFGLLIWFFILFLNSVIYYNKSNFLHNILTIEFFISIRLTCPVLNIIFIAVIMLTLMILMLLLIIRLI